jgi:hypothetical protein
MAFYKTAFAHVFRFGDASSEKFPYSLNKISRDYSAAVEFQFIASAYPESINDK